ncbi:hypothetical protein [Clostridium rectalis]|uniref:hypothetical protein n=1 Tax=Clostridium rectalis TaxID=2040295 RepID=UPI000F6402BA|nr:hypothetical protein [Clostridium rectalis]
MKNNKKLFKQFLSLLMTFCLSFSFFSGSFVFAKTSKKGNIKVIKNDKNICEVVGEYKGDELHAIFDKKTNKVTMKSIEKPKNMVYSLLFSENKVKNYEVEIHELRNPEKPGIVSATIIDKDTKKEYKIQDDDKVKAQAPAAVPLLEILGAQVLEKLGELGLLMIISNATYAIASSVADELTSQRKQRYFEAYIDWGKRDVLVGPAISYQQAKSRARNNKDIMCVKEDDAYDVAYWALKEQFPGTAGLGMNFTPVGPEIHGGGAHGYYKHYHLHDRAKNGGHIFFL